MVHLCLKYFKVGVINVITLHMAGEFEINISKRKGHRAYVAKVATKLNVLLDDMREENRCTVENIRRILTEKVEVIRQLDATILDSLDNEKQIIEEIMNSSEYIDDIHEAIIRINHRLDGGRHSKSQLGQHRAVQKCPKSSIKLEVKPFTGNPIEWQSFWSSFKTMVHDNERMEPLTKFTYLKKHLKGASLSSVSRLTLTAANYESAISILEKRYGNKQLLITSHIEKLLNMTTPLGDDIDNVRKTFDEIESCIRRLMKLNVMETSQYGQTLVTIVMSKMPADIKLIVSRAMPSDEEWNVEELLDQLDKEIKLREMCLRMTDTTPLTHIDNCTHARTACRERIVNNGRQDDEEITAIHLCSESEYCHRNPLNDKCNNNDMKFGNSIYTKDKRSCCLSTERLIRDCSYSRVCDKCQNGSSIYGMMDSTTPNDMESRDVNFNMTSGLARLATSTSHGLLKQYGLDNSEIW